MNYLIKNESGLILKPEISKQIAEFERQAKAIKEAQDLLKADILTEMEDNNIIKIDTPELTINYFAATYKETFDSKALKETDEDTYNKFIKISPVKSFIKINTKKPKDK